MCGNWSASAAILLAMTPTKARLTRWEDMPREPVKPGIDRRLVTTKRMMLAHVYIDKDAIVPWHSHENEQLTYILQGALQFTLGDRNGPEEELQTVTVHTGEVLHIPSHLPHRAVALEDTLDVDIFCPPRADWLDGTDSYFQDES